MSEQLASKLSTLRQIGLELANAPDLEQILTCVVEAAASLTEAEEASLALIDENNQELYVRAKKSRDHAQVQLMRSKVSNAVLDTVVEKGQTIRLNDKELALNGQPAHPLQCTPLVSRERTLGVLCSGNKASHQPFSEEDEQVLSVLAAYAALAIAHQQSQKETRRRNKTLSGLRRSQSSLLSVDDPQELLQRVADNAQTVLDADLVVLYEYFKDKKDVRIPPIFQGDIKKPEILYERGRIVPHDESVVFRMLQEREPFYAPDARHDWLKKGFIPADRAESPDSFLRREEIVSSTGIPLLIQNEVVGILFINYRTHQQFTPEHKNRIEAFANQAALALRNARIVAQKERRVTELAVLNEIGQAISSAVALDIDQILELVYKQTGRLMDVTDFYVAFYDESKEEVNFPFVVEGNKRQEKDTDQAYTVRRVKGYGRTEYVIRTQTPLLLSHAEQTVLEYEGKSYPEIGNPSKSWLGAPMIAEQKVLGVIVIQNYEKEHAYDKEHRTVLETIAAQAAIAIDKARLYAHEKKQAEELEALHETVLEIGSEEAIEPRLEVIVDAASTLLDAKGGKVYLKVQDEDKLELKAAKEIDDERQPTGSILHFGEGMAGHIMLKVKEAETEEDRKNVCLIVDDYKQYPHRVKELEDKFEAVIEVPLLLDDEAIGVLGVFDDKAERIFTEDDVPILQRFARQAVLAIRDARNLAKAQDHIRHLEIVNHVVQMIGTKLDKESLLQQIATLVKEELHCAQCTLFIPEIIGAEVWLNATVTDTTEDKKTTLSAHFRPGESLAGIAYATGTSNFYKNAPEHPDFVPEPSFPFKSMLVSPIKIGPKILGVICASDYDTDRFSQRDLDLIDSLALHVGIALERATALALQQAISSQLTDTDSVADVERILEQVLSNALDVLVADSGVIYLISDDHRSITHRYCYPPGDEHRHPEPRKDKETDEFSGLTGEIIRSGEEIIILDVNDDDRVSDKLDPAFKSQIGIPLKVEQDVIGVVYLNDEDPHDYTDIERSILSTLVNHAALAIHNYRLLSQISRARNAARAVTGKTVLDDLPSTLEAIVEGLRNALGCDIASIHVYDQDRDTFDFPPVMIGEFDPEIPFKGDRMPEDSAPYRLLKLAAPHATVNAPEDPVLGGGFTRREGIQSAVGLPLIMKDLAGGMHPVGVMFVDYRSKHHFTNDELRDIELFADMGAMAISNGQLYENLVRESETSQLLIEAGKAVNEVLSGVLSLDETLTRIVRQAFSLVGGLNIEGCYSVLRLGPDGVLHLKAIYPPSATLYTLDVIDTIEGEEPTGIVGRAYKTGQIQNVSNVLADPDYIRSNELTRSELVVPIRAGDAITGTLDVGHPFPDAFGEREERALQALADYVCIAIEIARQVDRITKTRNAAREFASLTVAEALRDTLTAIFEEVRTALDCDVIVLYTYNRDREEFEMPPVMVGVHDKAAASKQEHLLPDSAPYKILKQGTFYIAPNARNDRLVGGLFSEREGIISTMGVPLRIKDKNLGVLFISYRAKHVLTPEDREDIKLFADQTALAIWNAQLFEERQFEANKYETLLSSSPNPIIAVGSEGSVTYVNERSTQLFGYPPEEMIGQPVEDFYWEGLDEAKKISALLRGEKPVARQDSLIKSKQGDRIPILLSAALQYDEHGERLGSLGILEDQRMVALAGSARKLFEAIEAINRAEGLKDVLEAILVKADDVLGISAGCLFLRDDTHLIARDSYGMALDEDEPFKLKLGEGIIGQATEEQALQILEVFPDSDGDFPLMESAKSAIIIPLHSEDDLIGVLYLESAQEGHFRAENDLIPIFATQAAVAINRVQLLKERERTREQLLNSTQKVVAGQIATGFVHEVKNYLNGIKLTITNIGRRIEKEPGLKKKETYLEKVTAIKKEIERSYHLALRLQKFGQRHEPKKEAAYLNEIVHSAIELVESALHQKNIKLELQLASALDRPPNGKSNASESKGNLVYIDTREIEQVIINLILNAIQASRSRSPLTIKTSLTKDKSHAEIKVIDHGEGIKLEDLSEVFKPFFTTKPDGVGLGLYMCKIIVEENHRGSIEVESRFGKGTIFSVVLPRTQ